MTFRIFLFEFYHQDRYDKKQNRKSFPEFNNGKKSLWPFFKDGVQLPQGRVTKFPEIPGTHFIDLGRMTG